MFCKNCGASLKDDAKFCTQCGTPCESLPTAAGGAAGRPQPAATPVASGGVLFSSGGPNPVMKLALAVSCALYLILALVWVVKTIVEASDLPDFFSFFYEDEAAGGTAFFCFVGIVTALLILDAALSLVRIFVSKDGFFTRTTVCRSLASAVLFLICGVALMLLHEVFDDWTLGDSGWSYTVYTTFYVYGNLFKHCLIPLIIGIVVEACAMAKLPLADVGTSRKGGAK